jgi:hypothetical protein
MMSPCKAGAVNLLYCKSSDSGGGECAAPHKDLSLDYEFQVCGFVCPFIMTLFVLI